MIKVGTIGMIEKNAKSFPNIKASAAIQNGWFGTISDTATITPTTDTVKSADLVVVMNTVVGDNEYTDVTLPIGEYVNAFLLKEWGNQTLELNETHLAAALSTYAVGDVLVANADGKLVEAAATGYGISFVVLKKTNFCGGGLLIKIVVA